MPCGDSYKAKSSKTAASSTALSSTTTPSAAVVTKAPISPSAAGQKAPSTITDKSESKDDHEKSEAVAIRQPAMSKEWMEERFERLLTTSVPQTERSEKFGLSG